VTVSLPMSSIVQLNPDIREACILRGWWDNEGAAAANDAKSLSSNDRFGGDGGAEWCDFPTAEERVQQLSDAQKGFYFRNKATISMIKKDNILYQACPSANCNKKVMDLGNGEYRCEKCQRAYPNFSYRMMMQLCLQDATGQQWCSAFADQGEQILGIDCATLGRYNEEDKDRFDATIGKSVFQQFIFKMRGKTDVYNDEQRYKAIIVDVKPLDYVSYGQTLLKRIEEDAKFL